MGDKSSEQYGLKISKKTFLSTLFLLVGIMIFAGILTMVIPQGSYEYIEADGRTVIVPDSYTLTEGAQRLPIWRWFTAPVEVLFTENAITAIMIMLFILLIGGSFMVLEKSGIITHIITSIIRKFGDRKYLLMSVVVFFCMLLGSTMGMFEESVTIVPITVTLALVLGWDTFVGVGMSILAVGFGFAAGTFNPFTVGVTQNLADLPAFSGLALRALFFVIVYGVLMIFLYRYARKIEKNPLKSALYEHDTKVRERYKKEMSLNMEINPKLVAASRVFYISLLLVVCYIIVAFFVSGLSDYSMPVMAVFFTAGALVAGRMAQMKKLTRSFFKGMGSIAPSVMLIILAMSVTHIMQQGGIIDTILLFFYNQIAGLGSFGGVLAIFAFTLILEFFISGSASKAFLLIPIVIPLADMAGITRQTAVQSVILGDGFTNMIYPTSVVLLIVLGIVGVPYSKWFKWTWKIQGVLLILSALFLLGAVGIGYGPY